MPALRAWYLAPIRWPVNWFWRRAEAEDKEALEVLVRLVAKHWALVFWNLAAILLAALCEGSTLGLLAVAVSTLTDGAESNLAESLGPLGNWCQQVRAAYGNDGLFLTLISLAVLTQLLRSALQFGNAAGLAALHARIDGDIRSQMFRQFTRFSYAQITNYSTGDLAAYADQAKSAGKVIQQLNGMIGQSVLALSCLGVLFWLSAPLTVVVVLAGFVVTRGLRRAIGHIRKMSRQYSDASVQLSQQMIEFLGGLRLIRIFAREKHARGQLDDVLETSMAANRRMLTWQALVAPMVDTLAMIASAGFLLFGYWLLAGSNPNVLSRLATFVLVLYRMMPTASKVSNSRAIISTYWPMLVRVASILREDDKEFVWDGGKSFAGVEHEIEFENVSFRYNEGDRWAVRNLTFEVPRGQMVALVGKSGAGKSTVADLLLRLFDPVEGKIRVDGTPIDQLDLSQWRDQIGVVSQQSYAFNTSVRDNIAFGRLDATEDEIVEAAQAAHAHEFIAKLPEGYDTVIGERGLRLSGGQLQRLAIARAILRDPQILVLDEATSALDSRSERLIHDALCALGRDRTIVAIAHRLSTIAEADQILVMHDGEIVERGTHQQLLAADGHYARLWELQSSDRCEERLAAA